MPPQGWTGPAPFGGCMRCSPSQRRLVPLSGCCSARTTREVPMRQVAIVTLGALAGAVSGAVIPLVGDVMGSFLETATGRTFRAWELVLLGVWSFAIPGGALAGLLGAWVRKWAAGLALGAALHAALF